VNLAIFAGQWKQVQGAMLTKWGRLTANPFIVFAGEQYRINGRIQESNGRLRQGSNPFRPAVRRKRFRTIA
jgi:uncharacterized protein YjbJ (UPF0337 family)